MSFARQTEALLRIAGDYQAERCRAMLERAKADWQAVVKTAHAEARRELRARLTPERERLAAELARAEARLVTRRRQRQQRGVSLLLRQAWPRLTQALRARWEQPEARAAWVARQLALARGLFPAAGWQIAHPESWPAEERALAERWLRQHGVPDARFVPDSALPAGIRIACGPNLLDASLDGLLADRAGIEGRLLFHLEGRR
jgi:hypothetical protein